MDRRTFLSSLPLLPVAADSLAGQTASPVTASVPPVVDKAAAAAGDEEVLRVISKEVIVPVTVTDPEGRFVSDLDESDFQLFDEDQPQKISYFTRERNQPVVVGFLVDLSNRSRIHWDKYREGAKDLILALMPGDNPRYSGYLITYADRPTLQVNTTADPAPMVERLDKLKPSGGSSLYDAIFSACTDRKLVKGEPIEPRRVIVVIGDGTDNTSTHSLSQIVEIAQRNLVTIYGVSTVAFGFSSTGEGPLQELCEKTGGRVVYPLQGLYKDTIAYLSKPSDEGNYAHKVGTGAYANEIAQGVNKAIGAVIGEVTTQYIMRYIPTVKGSEKDLSKPFRKIRVEIKKYNNVTIRTRQGYYI
jgi:Ca-activated chloride channel homolog